MINKRSVFQRLIIFTVEGYLEDITADQTYRYDFMIRLRSAIRTYMRCHKFTQDEAKVVISLSDTPFMLALAELEIDRTIYALELLVLYIKEIPKADRALLNISDKKIIQIKTDLIMDMLKMRRDKPDAHKRVSEIISDSRINAKKYYSFCETEIVQK